MSVGAVRDFWQKAQTDQALQQQMRGVKTDDMETAITAVVRVAAAAGFSFTPSEYEAALKEELARRHTAGELSDEELSAVAGGSVPTYNRYCSR